MIITLPLGCLKAGDIEFQPALPEWKTDAIAKLGYGNLNKVGGPSRAPMRCPCNKAEVCQRWTMLQQQALLGLLQLCLCSGAYYVRLV